MPDKPNFLLGFGERLVESIAPPPIKPQKQLPYTFAEAKARIAPKVQRAATAIDALPQKACPEDHAVGVLTLHPQFIAKTLYPKGLLRSVGLESIGSRPGKVVPEKWTKKGKPASTGTTEIFVAGPRKSFRDWASELPRWTEASRGAAELHEVEDFHAPSAKEKIQTTATLPSEPLLEVVLHASAADEDAFIVEGFGEFLRSLDLKGDFDRRIYAGGLCFLPLRAPRERVSDIARFSFLRVVRQMPRMRDLSIVRTRHPKSFPVAFPEVSPVDPSLKVAVFDGGIPKGAPLPCVTNRKTQGLADRVPHFCEHGHNVTAALLFGPLQKGVALPQPYAAVDHYRVLDTQSAKDPYELYDVLMRIKEVLQEREPQFLNLSIGPDLPVEDTEVHSWTAVLDEYLSKGDALATIAIGNTGENDRESGNARIQVPSDCVNALAVGAADSDASGWNRAPYSAFGPGRSPGLVKPDILAFGGADARAFWVPDPSRPGSATAVAGTSFAAPLALRLATGVRAHFGDQLRPLALKALLVHCSEEHDDNKRDEHGWGRIPSDVDPLVLCPEGEARIVYQGELTPGEYVRAAIPIPVQTLKGKVSIRATFCFATATDPQDPGNYTKSGLDIVFRPHADAFKKGGHQAKSAAFFQLREFMSEDELRRDAHKWETTLHKEKTMLATSLKNPVFDIHYNAREGGSSTKRGLSLRYALVLTIRAPKEPKLYDHILARYRTLLEPLQPAIRIPVRR